MRDWVEWHRNYERPNGRLARRLAIVQDQIARALDTKPPGPIRVISMCAGEGRDLLGVLSEHPRGSDVVGRLVELDPQLAARARAAAPESIVVHTDDAGTTTAYAGAVPADLVLVCGVFGNIGVNAIGRTIATLPSLCAPNATVIWTRHRRPPDRAAWARDAFRAAGFAEVAFVAPADVLFGVGVHRLAVAPLPFVPDIELFEFEGYDTFDEPCAECGFVYDLTHAEIVQRLERDARVLVDAIGTLDDDAVRRRPEPSVWSPLEYACHVRDMLGVQRERIERVAHEDVPTFTPMGRDERVVVDRYNEQDPVVATAALLDAAHRLASQLAALDDAGWRRTGIYNYPTTAARSVEWIGNHTVHELVHHGVDVGAPSPAR